MKKIAVIHYMPVEYYPPTTNFLDIGSKEKSLTFKVWTTHNNKNRKVYKNERAVDLSRTALPSSNSKGFIRLLNYAVFNLKCLLGLLLFRPSKILYFESVSVWPVYVYKRYVNPSTEILIHYHEYFSPYWYANGMRLVNYYHKLESKYLYIKASWISQTNKERMAMFLEDNQMIDSTVCEILPNYPPLHWCEEKKDKKREKPVKSVYIGTLSLDYSYIKEYCTWVISKKGEVFFDIYGYNYNKETLNYLQSINSPYINFYESGINYHDIPKILKAYDVGLILYKALTENYKYNAPNKLFEYLVCGLSVVYSDKMLGIKPYNSEHVKPIDFEALDNTELFNSSTFEKKNIFSNQFVAEHALKPLLIELGN